MQAAIPDLGEAIRALIARQLETPLCALDDRLSLIDDLGADLLSITLLALAIEEAFDIQVGDEQWLELETVGDVVACVSTRLDARRVMRVQ